MMEDSISQPIPTFPLPKFSPKSLHLQVSIAQKYSQRALQSTRNINLSDLKVKSNSQNFMTPKSTIPVKIAHIDLAETDSSKGSSRSVGGFGSTPNTGDRNRREEIQRKTELCKQLRKEISKLKEEQKMEEMKFREVENAYFSIISNKSGRRPVKNSGVQTNEGNSTMELVCKKLEAEIEKMKIKLDNMEYRGIYINMCVNADKEKKRKMIVEEKIKKCEEGIIKMNNEIANWNSKIENYNTRILSTKKLKEKLIQIENVKESIKM